MKTRKEEIKIRKNIPLPAKRYSSRSIFYQKYQLQDMEIGDCIILDLKEKEKIKQLTCRLNSAVQQQTLRGKNVKILSKRKFTVRILNNKQAGVWRTK